MIIKLLFFYFRAIFFCISLQSSVSTLSISKNSQIFMFEARKKQKSEAYILLGIFQEIQN